jgi:uncharacterized protein (DUF302 family)
MTIRSFGRWLRTTIAFAAVALSSLPALADEMRFYVKRGLSYDEVRQDLESAIEGKGLKIGAVGDLGDMLARTQNDVAKGPATYTAAHYFQFCSAMLAHKLTAADPNNIGHCPFLMFSYETTAKPGEVVVGYRTFTRAGSAATRAILDEADAMLDAIAREAVK